MLTSHQCVSHRSNLTDEIAIVTCNVTPNILCDVTLILEDITLQGCDISPVVFLWLCSYICSDISLLCEISHLLCCMISHQYFEITLMCDISQVSFVILLTCSCVTSLALRVTSYELCDKNPSAMCDICWLVPCEIMHILRCDITLIVCKWYSNRYIWHRSLIFWQSSHYYVWHHSYCVPHH